MSFESKLNPLRLSVVKYSISKCSDIDLVVDAIRRGSKFQRRKQREIENEVSKILSKIKRDRDKALIQFERKFDFQKISTAESLRVKESEFREAYSKLDSNQVHAIKVAYEQISWFAKTQMRRFARKKLVTPLGFEIEETYLPLERVGGYVPGGNASYPSTVLMICAPSRVAGVKEIVLATPPRRYDGRVSASVLVAADLCGVSDVLKIGGAQAIAALAYGTQWIKKVDLIAGPGNAYVTEAKRQVCASREVLIDGLAGPTELLIVADAHSNAKFIAKDMISQAEHGNITLCGVVSNSKELLTTVEEQVLSISTESIRKSERLEQIRSSRLFFVKTSSMKLAIKFARAFAPEHLEMMTSMGKEEEEDLNTAGLVLSGNFTPPSSSDYIIGTNHILPTGGTARVSAGLGVENFLKRVTIATGHKKCLARSLNYISTLANLEGLPNHYSAASCRFETGE